MKKYDTAEELAWYRALLDSQSKGVEEQAIVSASYFDEEMQELIDAVALSRQNLIDGPDFTGISVSEDEVLDMIKTRRCIRDHRHYYMTQIELNKGNIVTLIDLMKTEWMYWRASDHNRNLMLGNCLGDILAIT